MEAMGRLLDVVQFAAHKHRDQRRKNLNSTPYINHPLDVAHLLWFSGQVRDLDVLSAAILHDTIEDTDTTWAELRDKFGQKIADIVLEVSDDPELSKQMRKQMQIQRAPLVSNGAKLVKLADKISNLQDIKNDPPKDWSLERQKAYFNWAREVIAGLRGIHPVLEARFDSLYESFFAQFQGGDQA